jgi:hypothetical protein
MKAEKKLFEEPVVVSYERDELVIEQAHTVCATS